MKSTRIKYLLEKIHNNWFLLLSRLHLMFSMKDKQNKRICQDRHLKISIEEVILLHINFHKESCSTQGQIDIGSVGILRESLKNWKIVFSLDLLFHKKCSDRLM